MLRKLITVAAVTAALVGVASSALASSASARTATVEDSVTGTGVVFQVTGQAVETAATGSSSSISVSCQAAAVVNAQRFKVSSICVLRDVTTGAEHQATAGPATTNTATASGTFNVPTSHRYELCVGVNDYYGSNGRLRGTYEAPCVALDRNV